MWMLPVLVLLSPQGPEVDLVGELAAAVDLPEAAQRAARAKALARRRDVPLEQWLAACRQFGPGGGGAEPEEPVAAGANHHRVELHVLAATEPTDVYLYVPPELPPGPRPLLLWGHGAGGTGAREFLLWRDIVDRVGMHVLAISEFGAAAGWGFTRRERQAQLAALRWARRQVDVDENAVFVGGASRGGHMCWDLMLRAPDLFAGGLPCIGGPRLLPGATNNLRYLENLGRMPICDLQGAGDDPLLVDNLRVAFARLQGFGNAAARYVEQPDLGHSFDLGAVDWPEFFAHRREPVPRRVVRMAARKDEAAAAWLRIDAFDRAVQEEYALRVDGRKWAQLDERGQRLYLLDDAVARTARLAVTMTEPGRFVGEGAGVKGFRLLLTAAMLGEDGSVEVQWGGRTVRKRATPTAATLLGDFVERFDRTFLPIAEVRIP